MLSQSDYRIRKSQLPRYTILNNIAWGIDANQTGLFLEVNLISCSVDYNGEYGTPPNGGSGQIQFTNGVLNIVGGHLESPVLPMITIPKPQAGASVSLTLIGAQLNQTSSSGNYVSYIEVDGVNDQLNIGKGVSFSFLTSGTVGAVANWNPTFNGNSRALIEPYESSNAKLPALIGTLPADYSYPVYDAQGRVAKMITSWQ